MKEKEMKYGVKGKCEWVNLGKVELEVLQEEENDMKRR